MTRAFSFKRVSERSYLKNEQGKEEQIDQIAEEERKQEERETDWSESIGATATTAFNSIINPFESASTSIVNSAQKHKHNIFSKIESHSLSISNVLFGSELITQSSLQDPFDESDLVTNDMLANNTSNPDMEEALITSSTSLAGGSGALRFLTFILLIKNS